MRDEQFLVLPFFFYPISNVMRVNDKWFLLCAEIEKYVQFVFFLLFVFNFK